MPAYLSYWLFCCCPLVKGKRQVIPISSKLFCKHWLAVVDFGHRWNDQNTTTRPLHPCFAWSLDKSCSSRSWNISNVRPFISGWECKRLRLSKFELFRCQPRSHFCYLRLHCSNLLTQIELIQPDWPPRCTWESFFNFHIISRDSPPWSIWFRTI